METNKRKLMDIEEIAMFLFFVFNQVIAFSMFSCVWQCLAVTDSVNLRTSCLSYRAVIKAENIGLLTVITRKTGENSAPCTWKKGAL